MNLLWTALVLAFVTTAGAEAPKSPTRVFVAMPERVTDGASIVYSQGACRLLGVDAPERARTGHPGQPLGEEAFRALRDELMRGPTTVLVYGTDRYGRMLCWVIDSNGYGVNLWLVESGMGEAYMVDRSPFARGLAEAQKRAQTDKRGIWNLPAYESPESFRKRMRR
mgnify:FL=1